MESNPDCYSTIVIIDNKPDKHHLSRLYKYPQVMVQEGARKLS